MGEANRRAALVCILAWAGCATPAPVVEPYRPFRPYSLAPQSQLEEPASAARARKAETVGERRKEEPPAVRIDAALIRFAVAQRSSRYILRRGIPMPDSVRASWSEVLGEVDKLLRQPAARVLPLDVVRARVALDAELTMDREHYLTLPDGLAAGIRGRAVALDQRLVEVRQLGAKAMAGKARLDWPLDPVIVTSLFGMRADPFSGEDRDHQGVDLKANVGQLVQTAAPGVVIRAGWAGGHGNHVVVEHAGGVTTAYSHLQTLLVTEGTRVPARGPLGLAGNTGRSTGPHLHFEVRREGECVDPLDELPDPAMEDLSGRAIGAP